MFVPIDKLQVSHFLLTLLSHLTNSFRRAIDLLNFYTLLHACYATLRALISLTWK